MVDYILKAVDFNRGGQASAMVTGPISKELMHRAGYEFDGHTELLAHLTQTKDYVMMLAGERLKVSLVTIHCALREVPQRLDKKDHDHNLPCLRKGFRNKQTACGGGCLKPPCRGIRFIWSGR